MEIAESPRLFHTTAERFFSGVRASLIPACGTRFHISRLISGRLLLIINDANNAAWLSGKPRGEADAVDFQRNKMLAYLSDDDGSIYLCYDRERYKEREILVAKVREEDILAGKLVSKDSKIKILANKGGKKFSEISSEGAK